MNCRHCNSEMGLNFLDLGSAPPSNAYLSTAALNQAEKWYPLRILVCENCWLVQTEDHADRAELFSDDYAYFSSFSSSWLAHAREYVNEICSRFDLGTESLAVEVAANDGYLLQYMKEAGVPCYGVEPTRSTAEAARAKGIEIVSDFFGSSLAKALAVKEKADLITANNVLAHVPDINDFVVGFTHLLKPNGVATFEFPHLLQLIDQSQFDTVYHEHYSYLSLTSVEAIFHSNGLQIFDVEQLPTHGGSLRVYAQRIDSGTHVVQDQVKALLEVEIAAGIVNREFYSRFQKIAEIVKDNLVSFLISAKNENALVVAYGAAAKGNTLINFSGIRSDLISCVADRNPAKQGMFMPGSRIPIVNEGALREQKPDYVLIFPWNLRKEIVDQLSYIREWGGGFVVAIPRLEVF